MLDGVMPVLINAVEEDDDKSAVSVAVTAAAEIVRGVGAAACAQHLPPLVQAVSKVAAGEALCQVAHSEDDEPLEDEEEPEVLILSSSIQHGLAYCIMYGPICAAACASSSCRGTLSFAACKWHARSFKAEG